ncbi:hypothetical protein Pmar_PMAR019191 [Perkinsus marinus ATCC 50983]|uniref:Uncharacterized protein n=1 Tax=Perkinsus marinus (strain ATCC 50983 / TXsc) TaxID=423536 RepID=C5KU43_PERM5|nr:hypothetical protein Pmar_PMAR019191 [Perkinsus marinus ATCC 50983]EER12085.1 hypothetical protein Pmar_PMAR019191 [Perkinsus marinus ATCC 50983]|eukprot:XP_002780290.1 hypothetical protein Pmar_PMAR019191 [Perkinsus marinus ATCC 50983]
MSRWESLSILLAILYSSGGVALQQGVGHRQQEEPDHSIEAVSPLEEEVPPKAPITMDAYWDGDDPNLNMLNQVDWAGLQSKPPPSSYDNYRTAAKIKFMMPDLTWNPEFPVTIPDEVLSAKLPVGALSRFMLQDPGPKFEAMVQDLHTPDYMLDVNNKADGSSRLVKRVSETQLQTDSGVDLSAIVPHLSDIPTAPPPIDPDLQYVPRGASEAVRKHPVKIAVNVDDNGRELWQTVERHVFGDDAERAVPRKIPNKIEELKETVKKSAFLQRTKGGGKGKSAPKEKKCDPNSYDPSKKFEPCKHIEYRAASRPEHDDESEGKEI